MMRRRTVTGAFLLTAAARVAVSTAERLRGVVPQRARRPAVTGSLPPTAAIPGSGSSVEMMRHTTVTRPFGPTAAAPAELPRGVVSPMTNRRTPTGPVRQAVAIPEGVASAESTPVTPQAAPRT
ncbi:hypothetical protein M2157_002318 [Streptomyces sp. SAI-127]|nr:hypothetical protein [Streptomyces sp. SAI-127]